MKITENMSYKDMKKMAKLSIGRFLETDVGKVLCVEEDFPIMRVFNGREVFTINADQIKELKEFISMK